MHAIRAIRQLSAVLLCSAASIAQIAQSKPMPKVVEIRIDPSYAPVIFREGDPQPLFQTSHL